MERKLFVQLLVQQKSSSNPRMTLVLLRKKTCLCQFSLEDFFIQCGELCNTLNLSPSDLYSIVRKRIHEYLKLFLLKVFIYFVK